MTTGPDLTASIGDAVTLTKIRKAVDRGELIDAPDVTFVLRLLENVKDESIAAHSFIKSIGVAVMLTENGVPWGVEDVNSLHADIVTHRARADTAEKRVRDLEVVVADRAIKARGLS